MKRRSATATPYTTQPPMDGVFNERAKHLNSKGLRAFEAGNLVKAEQLFQQSLDVDVSFGPAHNNLGQVLLARHQLYLAAWEFEYAANLMPELAEPIINQGLAYETGERMDRAAELYELAYSRHPTHPVAIASLVRVRIKQDASPDEIGFLLDELIMHDGRQEWVTWAKELRSTRYRDRCEECPILLSPNAGGFGPPGTFEDASSDAEQIVPSGEWPISELIPAPLEPLRGPDGSDWIPAVEAAPSVMDQSLNQVPEKPLRIPFAAPHDSTPVSSSGVKQVSFEIPGELLK